MNCKSSEAVVCSCKSRVALITCWPSESIFNNLADRSEVDPIVDRVERTDRLGWFVDRFDRLHRLVDDFTTRLDLDDFRSTWSTCGHVDHSFLLVLAYCMAADATNSVSKHLMPSQFQVEGLLA